MCVRVCVRLCMCMCCQGYDDYQMCMMQGAAAAVLLTAAAVAVALGGTERRKWTILSYIFAFGRESFSLSCSFFPFFSLRVICFTETDGGVLALMAFILSTEERRRGRGKHDG